MKFKISIHRLNNLYDYHGIIVEGVDYDSKLNEVIHPAKQNNKGFHSPSMGKKPSWYNEMFVDGGDLDETTVKQIAESAAKAVAEEHQRNIPAHSATIKGTLTCSEWDAEKEQYDTSRAVQFYRTSLDFCEKFSSTFLKILEAAKLAAKTKVAPDSKATACHATLVHNMQGNGGQVRAESKAVSPVDAVKNLLTAHTKLSWECEYSQRNKTHTFYFGAGDKLSENLKAMLPRFNQQTNDITVSEAEISNFVKILLDAINKPTMEKIAQNTESAKQLQARKEAIAKELQQIESALLQTAQTGKELEQALVAAPALNHDQPVTRLAI